MANSIAHFKKYIAALDDVYKLSALTADLDSPAELARQGANANEIIVQKLDMDGLADYSRNSGYVDGSVTLTNETVQFNFDRGRRFSIDAMDNEETAGLAFGRLASEFIRTKVVPELDAFRFAAYAGANGISKATPGTLADGGAVLAALIEAQTKMDEDEVPSEDRQLRITPGLYNAIQAVDTTKSREVLGSFASIRKVPQSRFYTAIEQLDGTSSGEEKGGYKKATNGKDINFMIFHKAALIQYTKHTVSKIVTPEENQSNLDGWLFFFRAYGLADVYENKVAGIYLHHQA